MCFLGCVTATMEALVHCNAISTQGFVHARPTLKEISVRCARMEHTTVTQTIQMGALLASVLVDLMFAPQLKALLNPT